MLNWFRRFADAAEELEDLVTPDEMGKLALPVRPSDASKRIFVLPRTVA